jgi:hypothetical protein
MYATGPRAKLGFRVTSVLVNITYIPTVIDALDECEGETDIRIILRLLAEARSLKNCLATDTHYKQSRGSNPLRFPPDS